MVCLASPGLPIGSSITVGDGDARTEARIAPLHLSFANVGYRVPLAQMDEDFGAISIRFSWDKVSQHGRILTPHRPSVASSCPPLWHYEYFRT